MDRTPIQYRQSTEIDLQNVKDIAKRVIMTNYAPFLGKKAAADFVESGMSDKEIEAGAGNCTLMVCGEQTIGFCITNGNMLHLIMIDVPCQNSGYGSALLAHVEERLLSSYDRIRLQTFQENVPAVRFYAKSGWHIAGQENVPDLDRILLHFEKTRSDSSY